MSEKALLLTGIRASGDIHIGNYFGAIRPALERQDEFQSFLFVADLHALTTQPSAQELKENVQKISAAWLACGLDPEKSCLWRQSDVPEVLELAYVLTCVTSMGLMERAHSYKDAKAASKNIKAGIFYYPLLMAADILLYGADYVPVGKDQAQHLEMARDMATFYNQVYQSKLLKHPKELIQKETAVVPGTDGRKMSKSYDNGIDLFAPESVLKKQVMQIRTDSKTLEEPKDPDSCIAFQIFRLVASDTASAEEMSQKLQAGGYGYGDAKKKLLQTILEGFGPMREEYQRWMSKPQEIEAVLQQGADTARKRARDLLSKIRQEVGLATRV